MAQVLAQPSVAQQVLPWVIERTNNAVTAVHFESSIYGPLNTIMHGIFPAQQMFMIKPQAILREEADGNINSHNATYNTSRASSDSNEANNSSDSNILAGLDDVTDGEVAMALESVGNYGTIAPLPENKEIFLDGVELSFDSYSAWVPPRNDGGQTTIAWLTNVCTHHLFQRFWCRQSPQASRPCSLVKFPSFSMIIYLPHIVIKGRPQDHTVGYPDFIAVKATAALDNDTLISIVEVKRDGEDFFQGAIQLTRYLQLAAPKANRAPRLRGFLVVGSTTRVYELEGPGAFAEVKFLKEYPTNTRELRDDLHDIAGQYWA